jgi:hypothetical protein
MAWISADIYSSVSIYICNSVSCFDTEVDAYILTYIFVRQYVLKRDYNTTRVNSLEGRW